MKKFENRKLFLLCFSAVAVFSLYCLVEFFRGAKFFVFALALFALFYLFGIGKNNKNTKKNLIFAVLLAAAMIFSSCFAVFSVKKNEAPFCYSDGKAHFSRAVISDISYTGNYSSSYIADVFEVDGKKAKFKILLNVSGNEFFEYGEYINFSSSFDIADSERSYLRSDGIFMLSETESATSENDVRKNISYYLHVANEYLNDRFISLLGEKEGGFLSAIILGSRKSVPPSVKLAFSRSGISHILALSGLHLAVIASTFDFLLRTVCGKKKRNIILIFICALFSVFTGFSPSVARAAIMLSFVYAADIFGEKNDSLTALSFSAVLILIINGNAVYNIGFWLSFTATLGIITLGPVFDRMFSKIKAPEKRTAKRFFYDILKYFYGIFSMGVSAFLFTLPVVYLSFKEISFFAIVSNFIFIPLASLIIPLGILFLPVSYIPYVSKFLSFLLKLLCSFVIELSGKISDIRGAYISLNRPFFEVFVAILVLFLIVILIRKEISIKCMTAFLSLLFVFVISFYSVYGFFTKGNIRIVAKSVAGNDFVVVNADNKGYAVDISSGKYSFMYDSLFSVKEMSLSEVDTLILTHYHSHTENSVEYISERIKIRKVYLPSPEDEKENEIFKSMLSSFSSVGIEVKTYARGESIENGNITFSFAEKIKLPRSEKPIAAFRIEYKNKDDVNTFSYIESAAFESSFDYSEYFSSDVVFIGSHGAKRKFRTELPACLKNSDVIFADREALSYFRDFEDIEKIHYLSEYDDSGIEILYKNGK